MVTVRKHTTPLRKTRTTDTDIYNWLILNTLWMNEVPFRYGIYQSCCHCCCHLATPLGRHFNGC